MKLQKPKINLKVCLILLSTILSMTAAVCVIGWLFTDDLQLYNSQGLESALERYYEDVINRYSILAAVSEDYGKDTLSGTNFRYGVIKGYSLKEVENRLDDISLYDYMNFDGGIPDEGERFVHSYTLNSWTVWKVSEDIRTGKTRYYSYEVPDTDGLDQERFVIVSTFLQPLASGSQDLFSRGTVAYRLLYRIRYIYIPILAICLSGMILCLRRLLRNADPDVQLLTDRIPLDLFAAFLFTAAAVFFRVELRLWHLDSVFPSLLGGIIFAGAGWLIFLLFTFCLRANIRMHTGFRSMLLGRIGLRLAGLITLTQERRKNQQSPVDTWKRVYGVLGLLCLIELAGMNIHHTGRAYIFIWALVKISLFVIVWWFFKGLITIKEGAARMAKGNLSAPILTKGLPSDLAQIAENMNSLGKSFDAAVEEKMKSERFQMELITNVSHDIKTPITSIINYTDLLKNEKLPEGKIQEYISVLERQSLRLKRLLQDLIDASRASSGAVEMHLEKVDLRVFLTQLLGEFTERLEDSRLEMHTSLPEGNAPLCITVDARHLFRIFDNLLLNVCRYAQPGTRVYLDVSQDDKETVITVKNISAMPLNIPSEELMQRFVRGDWSRNTEGSGLGLSIASSLTSLMGGNLDLSIDGDLFKATVLFAQGQDEL